MTAADVLYGAIPMVLTAVAAIGLLYRLFTRPVPLESRPAAAAGAWATMPTRWGLGLVFGFHALVLVVPSWVLGWNSSPVRLYLLEGALLAVTLWALIGVFGHLLHFADDPQRPAVTPADALVVGAVLVFLVTGALSQLADRWATSWSAGVAAPYAGAILGNARPELVASLPVPAQVHTLAFFTGLAALPFSRFLVWAAVPARAVHGFLAGLVKPAGDLLWGSAWARAVGVFLYFVIFTVVIPSQVVDRLGDVPDPVRDAVVGGVWAVFLVGGLAMLRWAQRTSRI